MHFRVAQETWTPSDLERAQEAAGMPASREQEYIRAKIREHEAEIARRAQQIHFLRMELSEAAANDLALAARG